METTTKRLLLGTATGTAAALATAYGLMGRRWHLRWGATNDELTRAMPCDGAVREPNFFSTRAITVDAAPEQVWPFVVDETALPHGTRIRHSLENRYADFALPESEAEMTWVVLLEPLEDGRTRVISRNRARFARGARAVLHYLVDDPALFLFERDWLRNLARRASQNQVQVAELMP